MANLDVQPKRKSSTWIWIIFVVLLLGALFLLYKGCNRTEPIKVDQSDSLAHDTVIAGITPVAATQPNWDAVDFTIPKAKYEEITDTAIIVRGNQKYTIYSLSENVLFAKDASTIQPVAEAKLQQISASLIKRFPNAQIGIYGRTDSIGGTGYNKTLGAERANAVKNWFVAKGGVLETALSTHSVGETKPLATNGTEKGRAQNRSVEIIAFPDSTGN
ncbi:OmpA family protein [Mucilaginibacter glaciei]|uniref:OmpA family protein n=1 Tax=Mucilaginibacter glaciei TaxID=2772109 RepID=A0A926NIL4_9SPHI|nr:OmpA family protein [Mucilaginibacter glaciei]MBD1391911.1 OmpA family protein [Mucilaginibacter glaciei]